MTLKTRSTVLLTVVLIASFAGSMISMPQMIRPVNAQAPPPNTNQNACPPGYQFPPVQGKCLATPTCPGGFSLVGNVCQDGPPTVCPTHTHADNGVCVSDVAPQCPPHLQHIVNGLCSAPLSDFPKQCLHTIPPFTVSGPDSHGNCTIGPGDKTKITQALCEAIPGGHIVTISGDYHNVKCVYPATAQCPSNSHLVGTNCVDGTPTCSIAGTHFVNNRCEDGTATCSVSGATVVGGKCVIAPTCPPSNNPVTIVSGKCTTKPGQGGP